MVYVNRSKSPMAMVTPLIQGVHPLVRPHFAQVAGRSGPAQAGYRRKEGSSMATSDVCGNDYWLCFEVRTASGCVHTFDSFECAVTKLAPVCEHCSCRIMGHGVE